MPPASARSHQNRGQRIRLFVLDSPGGKPAARVPVTIVATWSRPNAKETAHESTVIGILATDHCGYLSLPLPEWLDPMDKHLEGIWLRPFDQDKGRIDALPGVRAKRDPLLLVLTLLTPPLRVREGVRLPSIPLPDIDDWRISPRSFGWEGGSTLGSGACEDFLPSVAPERTFRFHQVVREPGKAPVKIDPIKSTTCDPIDFEFIEHLCLRRGVLLEYETTWNPLSHGLGQILYSLTLAPCESTKIAVIDWKRDDSTVRDEDTTATDQLLHNQRRDRVIEESVEAVVEEWQRGGSIMGELSISSILGTVAGALGLGGGYSTSSGTRSISADTVQSLAERLQQATNSLRRLRSTVVVQASQAERESIQTRVVTNHNHCHALTVLYYEILRHYRVETRLARQRDALLVKYQVYEFTAQELPGLRWKLERILRDESLKKCLTSIDREICHESTAGAAEEAVIGRLRVRLGTGEGGKPNGPVTLDLRTKSGVLVPLVYAGEDASDPDPRGVNVAESLDEIIVTLQPARQVRALKADKIVVSLLPGTGVYRRDGREAGYGSWDFAGIRIEAENPDLGWVLVNEPAVDIQLNKERTSADFTVNAYRVSGAEFDCCVARLLNHLHEHRMYYSRILWAMEDPEERASRFDKYEISSPELSGPGQASRLIDMIENRIVGIAGEYVAFPMATNNLAPKLFPGAPPVVEQIISVPTRGAFAESKLSHCNACETRDPTRFWDWSESPCPGDAPEIAPIESGSRYQAPEGTTPTPFPSPVVNIVNPPSAPDPAGLSGVLGVLSQSEIFRDMSGRSEIASLLEGMVEATNASARAAHDHAMVREAAIDRAEDHQALTPEGADERRRENVDKTFKEPGPSPTGAGGSAPGTGGGTTPRPRPTPAGAGTDCINVRLMIHSHYAGGDSGGELMSGIYAVRMVGPTDIYDAAFPIPPGGPFAEDLCLTAGRWAISGVFHRGGRPQGLERTIPLEIPGVTTLNFPLRRLVEVPSELPVVGVNFTVESTTTQVILRAIGRVETTVHEFSVELSGEGSIGSNPELQLSGELGGEIEAKIRELAGIALRETLGLTAISRISIGGSLRAGATVPVRLEYSFLTHVSLSVE